jgi:O-antigen ligase
LSLPVQAEWWRPVPRSRPEGDAAGLFISPPRRPGGHFAFRALLAFTFVNLLAPQAFLPALRPLRLALLAAAAGVAAHLTSCALRNRPLTVRSPEMALTAALVAWAVVTVPVSYWPGASVSFLLDLYLKTVAIFWLLANVVDTLARLRKVMWALAVMSIPLALTAIKNYLTGGFIQGEAAAVKRIVGYEAGLTANPNDLALMLNLILALSLGLLFATRGAAARSVLFAAIGLQMAAVVVTFSRAGFLTLAAVVGLYLWRLVRRGQTAWVGGVVAVCLVGVALLPSGYTSRLTTITNIDSDATGSSQQRWGDMQAALGLVLTHPVVGAGVGMNTLALHEARSAAWQRGPALKVHNVYLELAVELGLPGLVLFVLLVRACLRTVRRIRRGAETTPALGELTRLAEGVEVALLAFAVAAFFYPVAYHFYFYYMAGLSVAAGSVHRQLSAPDAARS